MAKDSDRGDSLNEKTLAKIAELYGPENAGSIAGQIVDLIARYQSTKQSSGPDYLTERDVMLITYADSLRPRDGHPLNGLTQFVREKLKDIITMVHILPFSPYSSDDGFSVMDYRQVKSDYGDWSDVDELAEKVDLCFDLVINHASAQGLYFKGYLAGDPAYQGFFIEADENTDTSMVVRPRTLPLLHRYESVSGPKWCWTTFSEDQVDLNFQNPAVFLEMLDVLLFYVSHGARMVRLDAIAYLWKDLGTSCVHLDQTHTVVKLMRDVLDEVAPEVLLLTETNFPHKENISYFGDGRNEAQVVYNFPLPPLVLHSLTAGDASHLSKWAATIKPVSDRTTFLNFTASHDGIGVRPAATILDEDEFQQLIDLASGHGGGVSYKNDQQGQGIPYELNINYFDALNDPADPQSDSDQSVEKFLLSQSIVLVFMGIPAIYIHSLVGSRNWNEGVVQTGAARSINREKLNLEEVVRQLDERGSLRERIFNRYSHMIAARQSQKAFHPLASQEVLDMTEKCFVLARTSTDRTETIVVIHNVTSEPCVLSIGPEKLCDEYSRKNLNKAKELADLISDVNVLPDDKGSYSLSLRPYQFVWLKTVF